MKYGTIQINGDKKQNGGYKGLAGSKESWFDRYRLWSQYYIPSEEEDNHKELYGSEQTWNLKHDENLNDWEWDWDLSYTLGG